MMAQISEALIKVFVAIAVVLLPPLIAQAIMWARNKANESKIGAQSKIDDLFFDELQGAVNGLMDTAKAWKDSQTGGLTDAQKKQLNDTAIATAVNNLKQHGQKFIDKLPMQAASDWVTWHVNQSNQPTPTPPITTPAS